MNTEQLFCGCTSHATVLFRSSGLMILSLYMPSYNSIEQRMFTCIKGPSRLFSYQKRIGFKTDFRHAQSDIVHKSSSRESEKKKVLCAACMIRKSTLLKSSDLRHQPGILGCP